LRSRFGQSSSKNGLHGSKDLIAAIREIHFFFQEGNKIPQVDDLIGGYLTENVAQLLTMGLRRLLESKAENPVVWLAQWLKDNNPNDKIFE
uniref:Uncharacterized protein n=1 Tax=Romanomermis culicivorax TaxID=13658 RepID=A0A915JXQ5_ROMCU